jgi:hypothetical protein
MTICVELTELDSEIAVRAYTEVKADIDNLQTSRQPKPAKFVDDAAPDDTAPVIDSSGRLMVIDTETTVDRFQNLKVGYFKVYNYAKLERHGMFYDENMTTQKERILLSEYCRHRQTELLKVRDFVDSIFFPEVYLLGTLCVGFNLPFDLSRLAIDFGYSRRWKNDHGQLLGMSGAFSFKLSDNRAYPRLRIKHIDNNRAFIGFSSPIDEYKQKLAFGGNFVDCYVLAYALTGEKHSLKSAGRLYNCYVQKADFEWNGRITKSSLDYLVQDVDATYSLFQKLEEHYGIFGVDLPITKVFSAASIGKACLKMMSIRPAAEKIAPIQNDLRGKCVVTYYGGRTEDKVRKQDQKVTVLDFTSMYPTMCALMRLWDFIICDHIDARDCLQEAEQLLKQTSLDDIRNPVTWQKMNIIVEVQPDEDILPTRAQYGDDVNAWNIAVNYVTSDKKIWWALPDVLNSKLQTGRVPKITRAFKFIPVAKQQGLQKVAVLGKEIDPYKDNLFKWLIEYRLELQRQQGATTDPAERDLLDKKQKGIKTIANATSYGIYMQIDTEDEASDVNVYGLSTFECRAPKKEVFGPFFNPVIATLITAGARLILGSVERILANEAAVHAYCDTDSMMVPPQFENKVQAFFQPLNPYNDESVSMFKVEKYKDDRGQEHALRDVWFFGLSSKRYAIYATDRLGRIKILKASSHGLKHLMSPFAMHMRDDYDDYVLDQDDRKKDSWHKEVWRDIILYCHGKVTIKEMNEKYGRSYAMAKLAITTPAIMRRMKKLNRGKPYALQIKPFNFCIIGVGNIADPKTRKAIKPLAPFRKDAQRCAYEFFVDYHSGSVLRGKHHWKKFSSIFWEYLNHPEAKFEGDCGALEHRHLKVSSIVYIGKESNNLDVSGITGIQRDDQLVYRSEEQFWDCCSELLLSPLGNDARQFLNHRTLQRIQKLLRQGRTCKLKAKTRDAIMKYLQSSASDRMT